MTRIIDHPWKNGGDPSENPSILLLDNGHIQITADADTDADGSPDAISLSPTSQLETALSKDNGWQGDRHYVNARIIPYFVLPGNWRDITGVRCKLGDIAKLSYGDRSIYAIYADVGPKDIVGEASIAVIEALGHNPWDRERKRILSGIGHGVNYEIIPESTNLSQTINFETIQEYGKSLFGSLDNNASSDQSESVTWLEFNRGQDGRPSISAYAGSRPVYTRYYSTKDTLISFLQSFPNANTALVAKEKPSPDCPDYVKTESTESHANCAEHFVRYFQQNYATVRKEVERWFTDNIPTQWSSNAVTNGCVAHQVSALHLCRLSHPELDTLPSVNVDMFIDWALDNGWKKITSMNSLRPGDICVSGPTETDLDHIYCFVDYIDEDNAHVLHNQVFGLARRSLIGIGCGRWRLALRMPEQTQ